MPIVRLHTSQPAAWIEVTGEDAASFLQSQFSNDLTHKGDSAVTYGLWLDAKGHIHGDSFILQQGPEQFTLFSYYTPAERIISKLNAFIIADDLELEDKTAEVGLISVIGEGAYPEKFQPGQFAEKDTVYSFAGRRSQQPSLEQVVPVSQVDDIVSTLGQQHTVETVEADWIEAERIRSGIPAIPLDIGPADFPQEGGLEQHAVSFTKGCFLGQEVVARMYHKGRTTRKLGRVVYTQVHDGQSDMLFIDGAEAGQLRSRVKTDEGWLGLALIKNKAIQDEMELRLGTAQGQIVNLF